MRRYFNTEGICEPEEHYMVRLDDRLDKIKKLFVDRGKYFVINRGRQYGKTTTLRALAVYLREEYIVCSMDFQEIGADEFRNEDTFSRAFAEIMIGSLRNQDLADKENVIGLLTEFAKQEKKGTLRELFVRISHFCGNVGKRVVLVIDEIDSASDNQVFIDFLAQLRSYYLDRKNKPAFYSVILAGVYDIKNLKLKIRPEKEHKYNSPWNIAAKFNIEMSFSAEEISLMLQEYANDNHSGMDIDEIGKCIYEYTAGYPYLVSALCKLLDEEVGELSGFDRTNVWTREGVKEAVKLLLKEKTSLFDSMMKQMDKFSELREMLEAIIYQGKQVTYSPYENSLDLGVMFGVLKEKDGCVVIANRIFEMGLLNMFMAKESMSSKVFLYGEQNKSQFIRDEKLDMKLVLEKFVEHFTDIYGDNDEQFVEAYGRKFFLLYLKPIINGVGNYYLEAQTRDVKRTDVIVDYRGEQFIVELKIWHGNEYNERGEEQLAGYLDYFRKKKGYMLSFNFNKKKVIGVKEIQVGDKVIIEAVV